MAHSHKEDDEEDNSKEVLDFLNSCSKDELIKSFSDMFQIEDIIKKNDIIMAHP